MATTNEANLAAQIGSAENTGTGTGGLETREVQSGHIKDLLENDDKSPRRCSNPHWIGIFWAHFLGMVILITLALTHKDNQAASSGIFSFISDTFTTGAGRKVLGALVGCAVTGGLFSFLWVRILQCFKDQPIKICLYLYHFLVVVMIGVAFWQDIQFVLYFYAFQLVVTDLLLYLQRHNFPFTEALLRTGLQAVVDNSKMQCVAMAFMPIQIALYIFWILGFLFTLIWMPDNWYLWMCLYAFSYSWVGYFFHFIVHTFTTVLAGFWLLGLKDGYGKASKSCKMAFTSSMGPIALASFFMGIFSLIKAIVSNSLKIGTCLMCYQCVYYACCGWLEALIARYNEYVLCYVALKNIEFGEGSASLVKLFADSGMQIVVNEVGWDVALTVGVLIGFCVSGGVGIGLHIILWGSEFNAQDAATEVFFYFCLYGWLGCSTTSIGLGPLRSVLTTVFVVWAEEPESFSKGQTKFYNDLVDKAQKCPQVATALKLGGSNERNV